MFIHSLKDVYSSRLYIMLFHVNSYEVNEDQLQVPIHTYVHIYSIYHICETFGNRLISILNEYIKEKET